MRWFNRHWWHYLLAPRRDGDESWLRVLWCRLRYHPYPVVWFNATGYEPDMHCTNCGDDLG